MEAGQRISHYRLVEKIGEGGMGVVWKAEDTRLHRHVALKFVPEERARDAETVERHLREARAASALNHPNICSIHDIGEWEGRRFIVMELLEGRPLDREIGETPLGVDVAIDLAIQIAEALAAAHEKGIIHRDVKPANVFVVGDPSSGRSAKMLDFGLAKLAGGSDSGPGAADEARTALAMTVPGSVVGTVSYMSPEQALGKEVDRRSDIFSLGVVLYEMLTARRAFGGGTSAAVFDAILNRSPTAPVELNANVPEELGRILDKALEKDPALRYQSAADLGADLRRLRRDSTSGASASAASAAASGRPLRTRPAVVVAALAIAVLAAVVLVRSSRQDPTAAGAGDIPTEATYGEAAAKGPTIAVLPFSNTSDEADQEYFSDGLTEDLITELSRYRELSVIPRGSTGRYKGSEADVREIGEALGARYVLQGSVRKAGDRVRVSVQLSDADGGRSIWGNTYERDLTAQGLFELQDDLTQQLVNAIAGSYGVLARAELPSARSKAPSHLSSYDCVLRTYEYLQVHSAGNHLAARDCLQRVVELEPDYAAGKAWLGYLHADAHHHRWNELPGENGSLDRALELAEEAVRLDDSNYVSHGTLMLTHFLRGDYDRARIEAERTIELAPNNALWLALAGTYLAQQDDYERGLPLVERALELSPHPPPWYRMAFFYDHYSHGRYEEALVVAKRLNWEGDFREPLFLAATYGQLGRAGDAQEALAEMARLWNRPTGELRRELVERHACSPGLTDHLLEGLALAGLEGVGGP